MNRRVAVHPVRSSLDIGARASVSGDRLVGVTRRPTRVEGGGVRRSTAGASRLGGKASSVVGVTGSCTVASRLPSAVSA